MTLATVTAARVATCAVHDYRNLASVQLDVPSDGLVLVGDNGHGKTNLLEALYLLQLLRPVRGGRDAEGVRFDAPGWHVTASGQFGRAETIAVGYDVRRKKKKVIIDGVETPRLADAAGHLPSVYLSPEDQRLASGGPSERRRFLDVTLGLASRPYLHALSAYRHALSQRNAALRTASLGGAHAAEALDAAAVWEPVLAQHGASLWAARQRWSDAVAPVYAAHCEAIGERQASALQLRSPGAPDGATDAMSLASALERQRRHDARRGITHAGPHRDDLVLTLGPRELRAVGSAGQQRTAAMALRLLEAATLRDATGCAPVLLLDDPFAELDPTRTARILGLLAAGGLGQALLAVPRADDVPSALSPLRRFRIRDGQVTAA